MTNIGQKLTVLDEGLSWDSCEANADKNNKKSTGHDESGKVFALTNLVIRSKTFSISTLT